jgi:hypothetical protein
VLAVRLATEGECQGLGPTGTCNPCRYQPWCQRRGAILVRGHNSAHDYGTCSTTRLIASWKLAFGVACQGNSSEDAQCTGEGCTPRLPEVPRNQSAMVDKIQSTVAKTRWLSPARVACQDLYTVVRSASVGTFPGCVEPRSGEGCSMLVHAWSLTRTWAKDHQTSILRSWCQSISAALSWTNCCHLLEIASP